MASDVLFVPYVREEAGAFPVKIFEYMGAKKPIISFANIPIKEILRNEENSLLVEPPSAENWKKAFERLMGDSQLSSKLAKTAFEESGVFTWEKRGRQIAELLRQNV